MCGARLGHTVKTMVTRHIYAMPPLVEALCEIRFDPGRTWDWTIPGLLYAQVQEDFPEREQDDQLEIQWRADLPQVQGQTTRRLRFFNRERTALVQVSKDALVLNHLRPYPGWERFRSMLLTVIEKYRVVASPKGVSGCALRYINRIPVPKDEAILEHYLQAIPTVPKNLPETLIGWSLTLDIPHVAQGGVVRLEAGSTPPGEDAAFILDLRFTALNPQGLGLDDPLVAWIENAHEVIEDTFEASITDQARSIFQEELSHDQLPAR